MDKNRTVDKNVPKKYNRIPPRQKIKDGQNPIYIKDKVVLKGLKRHTSDEMNSAKTKWKKDVLKAKRGVLLSIEESEENILDNFNDMYDTLKEEKRQREVLRFWLISVGTPIIMGLIIIILTLGWVILNK